MENRIGYSMQTSLLWWIISKWLLLNSSYIIEHLCIKQLSMTLFVLRQVYFWVAKVLFILANQFHNNYLAFTLPWLLSTFNYTSTAAVFIVLYLHKMCHHFHPFLPSRSLESLDNNWQDILYTQLLYNTIKEHFTGMMK